VAELPSVLVVGIDTPIGLTVVRELGERGVPVLGIARSRAGVGRHSRWLRRAFVHAARDASLIDRIGAIGREHSVRLLMAISESDLQLLNASRDRLPEFSFLFADAARLESVVDKSRTLEVARAVGIEVPETRQLAGWSDLDRAVAGLRYPVILKWADPHAVVRQLAALRIPLHKAEYCLDESALREALLRYRELERWPLVQEYCPGHGLGHMLYLDGGRALLRFRHRRLHEWPPEGGTSTLCESLPVEDGDEAVDRSVELLRRLEWRGAAMVEYRCDPASGRMVLMEVNGRFWGSQPLAWHAGAPFAWFTYCVQGLGRVPEPVRPRAGVQCKYAIPDTKRLLRLCARRGRTADPTRTFAPLREVIAYLAYPLARHRRWFVFSWRDPLPFVFDTLGVLRKAVAALVPRVRGKSP
jgi:predicted ATP-grasp superfamily ATP-dependent carboligase